MDNIIKGMWNQIVGPTGNPVTNNTSAPEEEEKKAPCIFDDNSTTGKKLSPLQAYEKKNIKIPECPAISAKDLASKITVATEHDLLKIDTVIQIMKNSLELSRKGYVDLVISNRKERRKVFFSDKKAYCKHVIILLKETENVMNQGTDDLLLELKIDKENFETSLMVLMEQGFDQHLLMTQAAMVQRTKEFLGSEKAIKSEEIKNILRYQLSLFTDRQDEFKELIGELKSDPENGHFIPLGINLIVSDLNYDKFELEEEDIMTALKDPAAMMGDQELCGIVMACEDAMHGLLSAMGALPQMPPGFGL